MAQETALKIKRTLAAVFPGSRIARPLDHLQRLVRVARRIVAGESQMLAFQARLVDLAHDAVIVRDASGRITYWNHGATETYGWTADEALGQDASSLLATAYPVPEISIERALAQHGAWDGEVVQRCRDGTELVVETRWATVRESRTAAPSILEVSRDVTARRRADQALEHANHQLEETLLRANELAVMAQAADLAKSEFLANMSHEIRTPMNGVMGIAELLFDTDLDAQQREYVAMIQTSAEALLTVINDVLDFSKIEAGRLDLESIPCDVRAVLDGARNLVARAATMKGLALTVDVAPDVPDGLVGDPNRLRQIVLNLLSNAIKFTHHGEVRARVAVVQVDDASASLRFEVRDTGVGIDAEALSRLFESFVQASEATAREYGGTGLGLAISKRLSEMMGGKIGVDSEPGVGSTFWFTARFERGAAPAAAVWVTQRAVAAEHALVLPRILVAEDAPINQRVTRAMLQKLGFEADVVCNGREAVEALAVGDGAGAGGRSRYGAVLMDCRMPVMDGYEATAAIREAEARRAEAMGDARRIPIIALTASAVVGVREGCLAAGMDDYLTKPLRSADLDRVLGRWVVPLEMSEDGPESPESIDAARFAESDGESPVPGALEREPAASPVLDPDNLAQLGELGDDIVAELAGIFLADVPSLREQIQQAVSEADAERLRFTAHRMRSEVRTWGAHRLDDALHSLEQLGAAGTTDGAVSLLPELWAALAEVVAALEGLAEATAEAA